MRLISQISICCAFIVLSGHLVAVVNEQQQSKNEEKQNCEFIDGNARRLLFEGHTYIQFKNGVIHDPECICGDYFFSMYNEFDGTWHHMKPN